MLFELTKTYMIRKNTIRKHKKEEKKQLCLIAKIIVYLKNSAT